MAWDGAFACLDSVIYKQKSLKPATDEKSHWQSFGSIMHSIRSDDSIDQLVQLTAEELFFH